MRVLILGPWCIRKPLHGGQIRASKIVETYRAAGHEVLFVGLYDPAQSPSEYTEDDHPITPAIVAQMADTPGSAEMRLWRALADEPVSFEQYRKHVIGFMPDVIQFEEPVFWPLIRRLMETGTLERPQGRIRILHSSYNIEHAWRRDSGGGTALEDGAFFLELEALEYEIARRADAVCVVSEADAAAFDTMAAGDVVVAPNGTALPTPTAAALRTVRQYLGPQPFALFVSSAHPPNASGLMHMVYGAPGLRLRHGVVIVCGDVARLLQPMSSDPALQHLFRDMRLLGRVPGDELLAAFYAQAHVAIIPRLLGGGSNLKSAEALLSGRPIVATSRAFVGFEAFAEAPGIHIADEPAAFWRQIDTLLGQPPSPPIVRAGVEALAWRHTLAPMVKAAEMLV